MNKKILKGIVGLAIVGGITLTLVGCGNTEDKVREYAKDVENAVTGNKTVVENNIKDSEGNGNNVVANNQEEQKKEEQKKDANKTFSKEDLKIKSFYLGDSAKSAESALGSENVKVEDLGMSGATGEYITTLDFKNYGVKVWSTRESEDDNDGSMNMIEIYGDSKIATARGIKIGSSRADILKAYPADCILVSDMLDEDKTVSVGMPGSDPVYGSTGIGTIHFHIENEKVSSITIAYAIAE